ncbi:hypothetical protein [Microbacterium aurantiacum]
MVDGNGTATDLEPVCTQMTLAPSPLVVAQVWFWVLPLYGIDGQGTYVFPFPFGSVDVVTTPMPTS